ncbi:hypothetical protein QVN87_18250 [Yersinia intermedia]|nr:MULTISPECIES: hypothetical protein [Yersinia]MDN0116634.1 hypothetical protein [Yersinia intermedia]
MANGLLVGANNEGHADSTTHAAVSDGTITVRDTDKQQQNVDDLSRDVEHANNALSPTQGTNPTLHGGGTQIFLPTPKDDWIIKK